MGIWSLCVVGIIDRL